MSQYTTQLRWWVESVTPEGMDVEERIAEARKLLFNFSYPIDLTKISVETKEQMECDFIRHFYTQEICCETWGLWKVMLRDKFITSWKYWSQLLIAATQISDPLFNSSIVYMDAQNQKDRRDLLSQDDINEKNDRNITGSSDRKVNDHSNGNNTHKEYDVPSRNVSDITDHLNKAITDTTGNDYTSSDNLGTNSQDGYTGTRKDTFQSNDKYESAKDKTSKESGYRGKSQSVLFGELMENLQNIEHFIFKDCEDLFMLLW